MNVVEAIQAWVKAHSAAVRIETLQDAPGWSVSIALAGTPLEGMEMSPYREGGGARDWLAYRIRDGQFEGRGDPTKLHAILFAFFDLAARAR